MASNRREHVLFFAICAVLCATVVYLAAAPVTGPPAAAGTPRVPAPPSSSGAGWRRGQLRRRRHLHRLPRGEGKTLPGSLHGKSANARTPAAKTNQACETCHGPGREHAESGDKTKIRVFPAMAPHDASAVCLTCHNRGNHAGWEGSGHERRNLSCTHVPQRAQPEVGRTAAGQGDRDAALRHVPPAAGDQDRARRGAHAGARGQDVVQLLP